MSSELVQAAKDGNLLVIKRIIYPGWIYPRMVLSRFYNKSHFDIRTHIAEFVGVYGFDINNTKRTTTEPHCPTWTALHHASAVGNPDCVEILLKNGGK